MSHFLFDLSIAGAAGVSHSTFLALGSLAFSLSSLFNGNGDAIPLALDARWKMGFFNGEICFPLGVVFRRIS